MRSIHAARLGPLALLAGPRAIRRSRSTLDFGSGGPGAPLVIERTVTVR